MKPSEYKATREKLKMTQAQLADRLGVTRKTVNARETGATTISKEAAMSIAAIDLTPETETR